MTTLLRGGWRPVTGSPQFPVYPTAATTGPAAGGYATPTPVTISANTNLNATGYPSWATPISGGLQVSNVAFTVTAGTITVNAPAVTFQGCTFSSSTVPGTNGPTLINLLGAGPYLFNYCSMYGSDGTTATRVMLCINQGADAALTISGSNIYYMKQAVQLFSGTAAGVSITGNYMHDIVNYATYAPTPSVSTAASGGTVLAGTYQAVITYYNSATGETLPSVTAGTVTTTGAASTITITSPAASTGQTGWYAYVTQAGGSSFTRQQASGSPTAIGTSLTLTAPPTSSGAAVPSVDHSEHIYAGASGGGSNITISGNTLLNPLSQTACIYLHPTYNFTNCAITGNLLAGGDYPLYCGGSGSTGIVVANNVFSTVSPYYANSGYYDPVYTGTPPAWGSSGNTWSNNTWYDGPNAGQTVASTL